MGFIDARRFYSLWGLIISFRACRAHGVDGVFGFGAHAGRRF